MLEFYGYVIQRLTDMKQELETVEDNTGHKLALRCQLTAIQLACYELRNQLKPKAKKSRCTKKIK